MEALDNLYSHLTNTSINKLSPTLDERKEVVGSGCRWTIHRLREYFLEKGVEFETLWAKIKGIIALTLLPVAPDVPADVDGCFELYGFEINLSPALSIDSDVDVMVKKPLISDIAHLIGLSEIDAKLAATDASIIASSRRLSTAKPAKPTLLHRRRAPPAPIAPTRVGGFTRIFPFNDTTTRAASSFSK
ncbi:putative tubulin polyglutamylase ttll2, partial [Borealophlyctis nickersoniae]